MIPISQVDVGSAEEELVLAVLRSGQLAQGPMVRELEAGFAALSDCEHAVAVSSGTVALAVALECEGIGTGDEVITSPFTFVATVAAILSVGATVRFADIGADFNIDPQTVGPLVNSRTAAIVPVHLYGQAVDMPPIDRITRDNGLALIEDCAQAPGATVVGRPVGSFGTGCFSLYATKNVAAGEGGVLTTNDPEIADKARLLRNQGMRARYEYELIGHNYRLTDLQAAIAMPQLARLSDTTSRRRHNATVLSAGLAGIPGLIPPRAFEGRGHVWHQYTIRVTKHAKLNRNALSKWLTESGISSGVYYPKTVPNYTCYAEHPRIILDPTPEADAAASEVLSLPVHPHLSPAQLDQITACVRTAFDA